MIINYNDSILNYVSSIRKFYGLSSSYEPNKQFDELIRKKNPKKIFMLLIDGMGANLIEKKLDKDSFLRKHMLYKTTTVFPTTTTAATIAIRNGKAPNENAWLAWVQHVDEVEDEVIPFLGISYYGKKKYGGRPFFESIVPVKFTVEELNEKGINSRIIFPSFEEDGSEDFDNMCNRLINYSYNDEYQHIYAYWDKYDTYMHEYSPNSEICDSYLLHINYEIERVCENLCEDTMLVVVADHGQIELKRFYDFRGSKYEKLFKRRPTGETRAQIFYIKDDCHKEFEELFNKEFNDDFILLSHSQVLESKIFGLKENHKRFDSFIGDYLAIAKSDMAFVNIDHEREIKGHHAGICDDELMIPVIVYKK